jgi:hypothetical protein
LVVGVEDLVLEVEDLVMVVGDSVVVVENASKGMAKEHWRGWEAMYHLPGHGSTSS